MKKYIFVVMATFAILSCNPVRQAQKAAAKADTKLNEIAAKYPVKVITKAAQLAPLGATHSDTVYVSDSAAYRDALQMVTFENTALWRAVDSMKALPRDSGASDCYAIIDMQQRQIEKLKALPPVRVLQVVHDTIPDSRGLVICMDQNATLISTNHQILDENVALKAEVKKYKDRSRNYLWIIIALAIGAIGYTAYKLKK